MLLISSGDSSPNCISSIERSCALENPKLRFAMIVTIFGYGGEIGLAY